MKRLFATALLASLAFGPAAAQDNVEAGPPAEQPPVDFEGRQYVDSRGCVYVRAGLDGNVTWVPRMTSDRRPVCGEDPTFPVAEAAPSPAPDQPPADDTAEDRAADDRARAEAAAPASAPAPRTPARTAPAARTAARTAAPKPARAETRGTPLPPPPEGYEHVWKDDRLNPDRGKQTLTGALQTALVWTQSVPRRLVDPTSGEDMTERLHYLVYPYTEYDRQLADLRAGTHVMVRTTAGQRIILKRSQLRAIPDDGRPGPGFHVSTRSVSAATDPVHVEVGTFANAASAGRVIEQLAARGLDARMGRRAGGNPDYRLVLVGPFTDPRARDRALEIVRSAGYTGARLR